jgi:hypothetical protein
MPRGNPPILLALVLCDTIIREEGTHKFSLIGTFNTIGAGTFPCVQPSISVYFALTDGRGKVPCVLRVIELESGQELFKLNGMIEFRDPTVVAELSFTIQRVRFPKPGEYALEIQADGELLGTRKLRVQEVKMKDEKS